MHINETLWRTVCDRYKLGSPAQPPRPVAGGMQHRLYRAEAGSEAYAVKVLHPALLREPGRGAQYVRAERLAQRMAGRGIPAVCALDGPDGPLETIGETTVALFPWREGTTLPPSPAFVDAAGQIGVQMGRIHRLAPNASEVSGAAGEAHLEEEWAFLVGKAHKEGALWADALRGMLPNLVRWSRDAHSAGERLAAYQLWTHRDLDQKNVLWSGPHAPWLLDWEGAGPLAPALEVMGTALNWAGQAAGEPLAAPFFAFVQGYREELPLAPADLHLAACAVPDKWLTWLKFNMKRSLARAQALPDERERACRAVAHSLATLQALDREAPMRHAWCEEC